MGTMGMWVVATTAVKAVMVMAMATAMAVTAVMGESSGGSISMGLVISCPAMGRGGCNYTGAVTWLSRPERR